jgi:hypothetical protein
MGKKVKAKAKGNGVERMNMWKIIAIVFIALFGLAVAGGLFRVAYVFHSEPRMSAPTQEQMDAARALVAQELLANGDDISNYEVRISSQIMRVEMRQAPMFIDMRGSNRSDNFMSEAPAPEGNTIHVSLQSETKTHFYLVNIDTGKIVMHSYTEWMANE